MKKLSLDRWIERRYNDWLFAVFAITLIVTCVKSCH